MCEAAGVKKRGGQPSVRPVRPPRPSSSHCANVVLERWLWVSPPPHLSPPPFPMKRSREPFSFGFSAPTTNEGASTSSTLPPPPPLDFFPSLGRLYGRCIIPQVQGGWGSDSSSTLTLQVNDLVRIHLSHEESGSIDPRYIVVERVAGSSSSPSSLDTQSERRKGLVPVSCIEPLPTPRDVATGCWVSGNHSTGSAEQLDLLFSPLPTTPPMALVVEPGLGPLIHPLSPHTFLATHLGKKALCIHSPPSRLAALARDLHALSLPSLLMDASRVVVWMRQTRPPFSMQYLDSSPEVALACYRAGHSLYFNPSLALQHKYLGPLGEDLGMDFGARYESGGGGEGEGEGERGATAGSSAAPSAAPSGGEGGLPGGDIEVFAVAGTHATPWHFDAQENFTLQLRGTKRWRVCSTSPCLPSPLTNLHPSSASATWQDARVLQAAVGGPCPPPPPPTSPGEACFLLRPGSFLYVPSGFWHAVDSEDPEEGSLSINFSMAGVRWGDVVLRAITARLWEEESLRERVMGIPSSGSSGGGGGGGGAAAVAREYAWKKVEAALALIPQCIKELTPQDVLPVGAFSDGFRSRVSIGGKGKKGEEEEEEEEEDEEDCEEEEEEEESGSGRGEKKGEEVVYTRGRLTVMTLSHPTSFTLHNGFASGGFGAGGEEGKAGGSVGGFKWSVEVPPALTTPLQTLYQLRVGGRVTLKELLQGLPSNRGGAGSGSGSGSGGGEGGGEVARQHLRHLCRVLLNNGYLKKAPKAT